MIIDSKYTKVFDSYMLTRNKYDELYAIAVNLRDLRNEASRLVNNNLLYYLDFSKLDFIKEMREIFSNKVSSCFDAQQYIQVYKDYQNKFNAILRNIEFKKVTIKGFDLYKRNSKKHKRGDLKSIITDTSQTNLTLCLSYLARYGKEGTPEYLKQKVEVLSNHTDKKEIKRRELYQDILDKCAKFGFGRLFRLALSHRNRIIKHYSEHPIEYKSLTFGGRSRKQRIIEFNSNYNSRINAFISLSGFSKKSFDIPIKYAKYYHGRMKSYKKTLLTMSTS